MSDDDDTDFEDVAANQDQYSIFDDDNTDKITDHEQKRLYTERRRKIEDRIEAWKLKDELGIFDDQMYY